MEQHGLRLVSVYVSANYIDKGDILNLSTAWQCGAANALPQNIRVVADIISSREQRQLENQIDGFRFTWKPYPAFADLRPGERMETAWFWKVPEVWGGTFLLMLSLVDESGATVPFVGRAGRLVHREHIADLDVGWGWGRMRVEATRQEIIAAINPPLPYAASDELVETFPLGDFTLCKAYPAVCGFRSEQWRPCAPKVAIRDLAENEIADCAQAQWLVSSDDGRAVYHAQGVFGAFDATFSWNGGTLLVSVENVREADGYELLSVTFPELVSLSEEAKMAYFFCGGREVAVEDTLPIHTAFTYDVCGAVGIYGKAGSAFIVADDMDNVLLLSVKQNEKGKRGVAGVMIQVRIPAKKQGLASIPVPMTPLEIHSRASGDWQDMARLLRGRLKGKDNSLYDGTLFYKIGVDMIMQYDIGNPQTYRGKFFVTFEKVKEMIAKIYNVSGGIRQVVYLVGWQRYGHDSEYPYPHLRGFSPRVGTMAEWEDCKAFAKAHNAILSFHDNFDDMYSNDENSLAFTAVNAHGEPTKGWIWGGGMSYIASPKAYALTGKMQERVAKTVAEFGIEKSYHIDVLTSEVRRYDFSEEYSAAAAENVEYKKEIVREFNRYGVDVTSETMIAAYTDTIGYALHSRYKFGEVLFHGERVIPITTMIFHGITPYNMESMTKEEFLHALAYGAQSGFGDIVNFGEAAHIRSLYLHVLPMQLLQSLRVESCEMGDESLRVDYEKNSYTSVDFGSETYEIVADGRLVGKDFETLVPAKEPDAFLAFSKCGGRLGLALPGGWTKVLVTPLLLTGRGEAELADVKNGVLLKALEGDRPVYIEKVF